MGLLDSPKQCQGQPALWGQPWLGDGCSHLRLGSNHLHRLSFCHPLVGCGQCWHLCRIFLLVPCSRSLCEIALFAFFAFLVYRSIVFFSTPTSGTALTFPCCPHTLSITQGSNITSLRSSIPIPPSTSRLTRPTAPFSFPQHSLLPTASHLQPSPPTLHMLCSTTANICGIMLVARSQNNLTSTPA